jgi:hypothetical protein
MPKKAAIIKHTNTFIKPVVQEDELGRKCEEGKKSSASAMWLLGPRGYTVKSNLDRPHRYPLQEYHEMPLVSLHVPVKKQNF